MKKGINIQINEKTVEGKNKNINEVLLSKNECIFKYESFTRNLSDVLRKCYPGSEFEIAD